MYVYRCRNIVHTQHRVYIKDWLYCIKAKVANKTKCFIFLLFFHFFHSIFFLHWTKMQTESICFVYKMVRFCATAVLSIFCCRWFCCGVFTWLFFLFCFCWFCYVHNVQCIAHTIHVIRYGCSWCFSILAAFVTCTHSTHSRREKGNEKSHCH